MYTGADVLLRKTIGRYICPFYSTAVSGPTFVFAGPLRTAVDPNQRILSGADKAVRLLSICYSIGNQLEKKEKTCQTSLVTRVSRGNACKSSKADSIPTQQARCNAVRPG